MNRSPRSTDASIDLNLVLGLSVAQLIGWGSVFYGFSLFMAPIETMLSLTRGESSLAFSLALLMEGLAAFAVGRWIDQGHERRVMTLGSLAVGLAFVAHAYVQTRGQFYAVWLVLGLGLSATLYTPAFAVLTRRFPEQFRRAIIILTFLGGLASTVFIPLIAWLLDAFGWQTTMWVLGLLHGLVCAPLHAHYLQHAPRPSNHRSSKENISASPAAWRAHLQDRTFWLVGVFMVLLMAVTAALPAHLVNLLREAGLEETWVLALPAIVGVLQVVGRALLFVAEHRIDVHWVNRWVPCLIPLGFALLWLGGVHGFWAGLFVLVYGLGNGMFTIVKGTVVAQYVSQSSVGSLNGMVGLPMALARAGAPWFMGALWQPDVGYQYGLLWMMGLSCVGVAALWWAQSRARLTRRARAHS